MNIINTKNSFAKPVDKTIRDTPCCEPEACRVLDTADIIGLRTHHKPDTVS